MPARSFGHQRGRRLILAIDKGENILHRPIFEIQLGATVAAGRLPICHHDPDVLKADLIEVEACAHLGAIGAVENIQLYEFVVEGG